MHLEEPTCELWINLQYISQQREQGHSWPDSTQINKKDVTRGGDVGEGEIGQPECSTVIFGEEIVLYH